MPPVAQTWHDWQAHDPAGRQGLLLGAGEVPVEFDPEHLRRVLVNLLDNAQRYKGRTRLTATEHRAPASGQIGMPGLERWCATGQIGGRHLFEPFFSSESRSSGLGLYIAASCASAMARPSATSAATRMLDRGTVMGNAFTVSFRSATRPRNRLTV